MKWFRRYTSLVNPLEFSNLKADIQSKIDELLKVQGAPKDPEGFSLIDGFFYSSFQPSLSHNILIGGPSTIVNVAIIGNSTKVIYYYPIKALLPERLKDF